MISLWIAENLHIPLANKPLDKASINTGTSYLSGKLGSISMEGLSPLLNNNTEKMIINSVVSTPVLLFDKSLNKTAKVYLYNE